MNRSALLCIFMAVLLFVSNGCEKNTRILQITDNGPITESIYLVSPPEGFLPFPMHNPKFTQAQYDSMMQDMGLANNFGNYQGADSIHHIHDGLDIVLDDGTMLFAVDSGVVRYLNPYGHLILQRLSDPETGFGYGHVTDFLVQEGDTVFQGQPLCRVAFSGLPHVHFDFVHTVTPGAWPDTLYHLWPEDNFNMPDDLTPKVESIFHFFKDNTDSLFTGADTVTVSGKVDIAVGVSAVAPFCYWGKLYNIQNLAPALVQYSIERLDGTVLQSGKLDLREMKVFKDYHYRAPSTKEQALTLFKPVQLFVAPGTPNPGYSYVILTHFPQNGGPVVFDLSRRALCWDTRRNSSSGTPVFPDGIYRVRVKVEGRSGLSAEHSNVVAVHNDNA